MTSIGKKIVSSYGGSKNSANFADRIDEFFSPIPQVVMESWPFEKNEGSHTRYVMADFNYEQAGLLETLTIGAEINDPNNGLVARCVFDFNDEQLNIRAEEMHRLYGNGKQNSGYSFIKNCFSFLSEYDKTRKDDVKRSPSNITVLASSDEVKGAKLNGAYTLARAGFSFSDDKEVDRVRKQFKKFTSDKGIHIAEKDLALFTLPCHYAAFDTGVKVSDNRGGEEPVGKAFLLNCSWRGTWNTKNQLSKEKIYAKLYHTCAAKTVRKKSALKSLGPRFYKMVDQYSDKKKNKHKHSIKGYARLAKMKLSGLGA